MQDARTNTGTADATALPDSKELQAVHRASMQLQRVRDIAALSRDIVGVLRDVMHFDYAAVYLIQDQALQPLCVNDRGLGETVRAFDKAYLETLNLKVGENVTGWVARHGESVVINDVNADPRYFKSQPDIHSEICVPMRSRERIMGVINLESTKPDAYSESDRRVLEIVAGQVAIAIENAQLLAHTGEMKRLQLLAELSGGIAHDLGNLLSVIANAFDLHNVSRTAAGAATPQSRGVDDAIDKAIDLTRGLIHLGRQRTANSTLLDVDALIDASVPLLTVLAGRDIALTVTTACKGCRIKADAGQIEQVLMNLVVNARQATTAPGELTISTECVHAPGTSDSACTAVRLRVRDTGKGMDEATRARACEPFFSTRDEGSGLGLSTVSRIVTALGGSLDIHSTVGQGTTVMVQMPATAAND